MAIAGKLASSRPKIELFGSRSLSLSDINSHLFYRGNSSITITVPALAISAEIEICQLGEGAINIQPDEILINGTSNLFTTQRKYPVVLVFYTASEAEAYGGESSSIPTNFIDWANPSAIGSGTPSTVTATQYKLSTLNTAPSSATATGTTGEIRIDANYIYFCAAPNTWKRSPLSTWGGSGEVILHSDVTSWKTRVEAVGGSIREETLIAVDTLVKWVYNNGLRDPVGANHKIKFWLPLATNNFAGLFIPIWHPTANYTCPQTGFISTDYNRINGLKGEFTRKPFVNSGVPLDSNWTMMFDCPVEASSEAAWAEATMGVSDPVDVWRLFYPIIGGNTKASVLYNGNYDSVTASSTIGLNAYSATADGTVSYQLEGVPQTFSNGLTTKSFSPRVPPTSPVYLLAVNKNETATNGSFRYNFQGFLIGSGLTGAEITNFTAQYSATRTAVRAA